MKRLATTTVIRGNGACEVYMDGLLNEEIKKLNERHEKELSEKEVKLQVTKNQRDDLRYKDLIALRAMVAKPMSIAARLRERLVIIWCQIWGIFECLKHGKGDA